MAAFRRKREEKKHRFTDSDVVLIVDDEKFYVHSNILGFASPVFKTMLSSDLKEGKEKVINLPGKSKASVLILLNLIYPIDFKITDFSCCESLLELAREYDIKRVTMLVDDFLTFQEHCSFDTLKIADSFNLIKTLKKHVEYYGKAENRKYSGYTTSIFANKDWSMISEKIRLHILYKKTKNANYTICIMKNCGTRYCDHKPSVSQHEVTALVDAIEAFGKVYEQI